VHPLAGQRAYPLVPLRVVRVGYLRSWVDQRVLLLLLLVAEGGLGGRHAVRCESRVEGLIVVVAMRQAGRAVVSTVVWR
jgi:hypothetical protein